LLFGTRGSMIASSDGHIERVALVSARALVAGHRRAHGILAEGSDLLT
jgi:hypothetical protein